MGFLLLASDESDEQVVVLASIPSAEAFGQPSVGEPLLVGGIASEEAFGIPTVEVLAPAPQPVPYAPTANTGGGFGVTGGGGGGGSSWAWFRQEQLKRDIEHAGIGAEAFEWPKEVEKDEARRALRKVASWMHPDVVARLHPEAQAQLKDHFVDLTEAYEAINRREAATRGRTLVTSSADPQWEEFLRNLRPTPGALVPEELVTRLSEVAEAVNAAETLEDALPSKSKRKNQQRIVLETFPLPTAPVVQPTGMFHTPRPIISQQAVAFAAFLTVSFGAGYFGARTVDRALERLRRE